MLNCLHLADRCILLSFLCLFKILWFFQRRLVKFLFKQFGGYGRMRIDIFLNKFKVALNFFELFQSSLFEFLILTLLLFLLVNSILPTHSFLFLLTYLKCINWQFLTINKCFRNYLLFFIGVWSFPMSSKSRFILFSQQSLQHL